MLWYKTVFSKRHDLGNKAVVVDFDGTISEDGQFPGVGRPLPGAKEALSRLMEAGFQVVIFTCRIDPTTPRKASQQRALIEKWMKDNGIPYSKIDDGTTGKPQGFIVDNKAFHFKGGDDWGRICSRLLAGKLAQ